ncbi:bifunctional metallophosphatase/5'-nucleotidase [Ureibacillus aquaedulcis]|uniref:Bifunctional UDP-sugar hydrolase/5'-nucleotidase n=1 Tax=Ureibacillus aquaedulcis TaxID=3058421 RepID=A0ABT8GNA8_9BACL|nr:bifunctional UDP-sugar hydrolase/5'-nucleotidase [Ureibacillus sp. BA0131]MDN4492908.1 bifunctional UDP-sugar hydrolase/5'-nucleotidase [Ureibacillus sp. BA0131]
MLETIHIFHTNDVHSHFEYWQRMQDHIKTQRLEFAKAGEPSFLFDLGDHLDRSNIYTEATLGKGNVQLLNEAQYDVVTIGNNEGITLSFEELHSLYDEANFEVVVGNIEPISGNKPKWLKPYTILQTKNGTKIGVIGATAIYEAFYNELNWHIIEPRQTIVQLAHHLKEQVDILVCLSHLGISEDELLADECPSIDVIFGSHTHHLLEEGKMVNNVLLTGCGKFGLYTGHLTMQFDHATQKLISKKEEVIENSILPEKEGEALFIANLAEQGKLLLQTPIFQTNKNYNKEWFHYSQLSKLFAEAVLDFTEADCTMFNAGILLDSLKKGIITNYDIHKILPHPINICVIELSGRELKEVFIQAQNEQWPNIELKGLGFRGSIFGKMLTYQFSMNKQRELIVGGEVVDLDRHYKLATLDMFTFGYFFPNFKYAKKKYYLPLFLRDILIEYGKRLI